MTRHSRTSDLRAFLISFFNVSLVIQWVSKRFFSCCRKIAEIHEKIYKKYFVWRFPWNRSYADWQVLAWVTIYPLFLVTWVEKNDLPGSKAVTVLGREVTNICICAFKVGSFKSLLSRSFFQLTWLLGKNSGWMATHARTCQTAYDRFHGKRHAK